MRSCPLPPLFSSYALVGSFYSFCRLFSIPYGPFYCPLRAVYDGFRGWLTSYVDSYRVCVCSLSVFSPNLFDFLVHDKIFSSHGCSVSSGLRDSSHLDISWLPLSNLRVNLLTQLLLRSLLESNGLRCCGSDLSSLLFAQVGSYL